MDGTLGAMKLINLRRLRMENEISYDLGERIIYQMKELNLILKKKLRKMKNEKQCKNLFQNKQ